VKARSLFAISKRTESATENKQPETRPFGARLKVMVKRWCKRPPPDEKSKGQGKPRPEQDQIGSWKLPASHLAPNGCLVELRVDRNKPRLRGR